MSVVSKDEPPSREPGRPGGDVKQWSPRRFGPRTATHLGVVAVLFLFALLALPSILGLYYVDAVTQVAIYAIVCLGLGLLVAGSAWFRSARQRSWRSEPGSGAAAVRDWAPLRGRDPDDGVDHDGDRHARRAPGSTASRTLSGADHVDAGRRDHDRSGDHEFPNGGGGFLGYNGTFIHAPPIRRPGIAESDPAFLRYSIVVAAVMFGLVVAHLRTRPGRAWAAIRQSQAAALAAGINITAYKLWAFALASFVTGVAGALLGRPTATSTRSTSRLRTRSRCLRSS